MRFGSFDLLVVREEEPEDERGRPVDRLGSLNIHDTMMEQMKKLRITINRIVIFLSTV